MSGRSERHFRNKRAKIIFSPDVTHQPGGEFGVKVDQAFDDLLDLLRTRRVMTGHSPQVVGLSMHRLQFDRVCKRFGRCAVFTETSMRQPPSVPRTIEGRLAAQRRGERSNRRARRARAVRAAGA